MTTPVFAAIAAAWVAAWLVLLLFAAAAVTHTKRSRAEMRRKIAELSSRGEQLRLLTALFSALSGERRRRDVARAAAEFFVREMGAGRAAYWRPNGAGEAQSPSVSLPEHGGVEPLPEAQRIILARAAGRGDAPLIVGNGSTDQRPQRLDPARAPRSGFTLYVPLDRSPGEGVLEIYAGDSAWGPDRWEVLPLLGAAIADALGRARRSDEQRERTDVDALTGVFNHRFTQVYLEGLAKAGRERGERFALLLLDVERFSDFNESHGHEAGDRVLRLLADQLKLMTDRAGIVGRLGGDEFAVVLPEHSAEEAGAFAQAFQDWLENSPLKTRASRAVPIGVCWGSASFPEDGKTRGELLAAAAAKLERGRGSGATSAGGDAAVSAAS
jgi:diguanylate cyclase (GGDEF)-like protein